MAVKVLVVNPVVGQTSGPNEALWYAEPYFQQVYEYASSKLGSGSVTYLYERGAVRSEWASALAQLPARIGGVGHGNEAAYAGYRNEVLVQVGAADEFVPRPGAELFILSCRTAAQLGPWLVSEKGAAGYLGWRTDYSFWAVWGVRKRGGIDQAFLGTIEEAAKRWLAGEWTLEQAYRYIYDDYMAKASNPDYPPDVQAAFWLDAQYMTLIRGAAARTISYTVAVVLPDGSRIEESGTAPYPQPAYTVAVKLPQAGQEGEGKLLVAAVLEGRSGSAEVKLTFKLPSGLKVDILEPADGSTVLYGSTITVKFTVAEA